MADKAPYFRYWGKTDRDDTSGYHLLPYHCLDVAAVAKLFLERFDLFRRRLASTLNLTEEALIQLACFFLSLHDIGKFSAAFQGLSPDLMHRLQGGGRGRRYSLRHDSLGYLAWEALWGRFVDDDSFGFQAAGRQAWQYEAYFDRWLKCVCGHHGKPPLVQDGRSRFLARDFFDASDQDAIFQYANDMWRFHMNGRVDLLGDDLDEEAITKASWWVAGFTVLCDWLGSDGKIFGLMNTPIPLATYWEENALPGANKVLQRAGLLKSTPGGPLDLTALTQEDFQPTPLQEYIGTHEVFNGQQLWILEDITGAGKTEAAMLLVNRLMAAGMADGFFIGLPTMATADMMYARMARCYRRLFEAGRHPTLVLAHGSRHLSEEFRASVFPLAEGLGRYSADDQTGNAECTAWLADNRKKALLADAGVGTIDQALLAVLPARHQSMRLMGLSTKVLVVDEVHAYDDYMNTLLKNLLTFHAGFGGSAVLLSATLPKKTRTELVNAFRDGLGQGPIDLPAESAYPLVTTASAQAPTPTPIAASPRSIRRVRLEMVDDPERPFDILTTAQQAGRCACWIRNTVADAREAYRRLLEKGDVDPERVHLFHARFILADRLNIEKRVTKYFGKRSTADERAGRILIATQVVEQSLDLDFDALITDLAPMDLIIQRAGRLHRHKRDALGNPLMSPDAVDQRPAPRLRILSPAPCDAPHERWYADLFPRAAPVYPHVGRLWLTARLLNEEGHIAMPHRLRHLIEGVYGCHYEDLPDGLQDASRKVEAEARGEAGLGHYNRLDLEYGYDVDNGEWSEEIHLPTRLGEENQSVHLATPAADRLVPMAHGDYPWDLSSVRIAKRKLARLSEKLLATHSDALADLVSKEKRLTEYDLILPMRPVLDGLWVSEGEDGVGRKVEVVYDNSMGLMVGDDNGGGR
jgi:CRISPR-associated endonuclease/helicase Cas3